MFRRLTEIGWSNHLHILSKTKTIEEKEYYLMLAAKRNYSARDLARLIDSSTFERTVLANQKLSTVLTYLDRHKAQLEETTKVIENAKQNGWQRIVEMNNEVAFNLAGSMNEFLAHPIHRRYKAWSDRGIWSTLMSSVSDIDKQAVIDATIVRAHACASGYSKDGNEIQALGRSKGGFTTKIHALVDGLGNGLNLF